MCIRDRSRCTSTSQSSEMISMISLLICSATLEHIRDIGAHSNTVTMMVVDFRMYACMYMYVCTCMYVYTYVRMYVCAGWEKFSEVARIGPERLLSRRRSQNFREPTNLWCVRLASGIECRYHNTNANTISVILCWAVQIHFLNDLQPTTSRKSSGLRYETLTGAVSRERVLNNEQSKLSIIS